MKSNRLESRFAHLPKLGEREICRPKLWLLKNPIYEAELEYIVQAVYDFFSVAVATAIRKETMFTLPIGQPYTGAGGAALTKSIYHTNLVQAGQLDAPKKLLVKGVALNLRNDIFPGDLSRVVGDGFLQFNVSGKDYMTQLAVKCPAAAGGFASGTFFGGAITTPAGVAANGWPSTDNLCTLTDPMPQVPGLKPMDPILGVLIEQQQNFNTIYDPAQTGSTVYSTVAAAAGGFGVFGHLFLDGILLRAVL
jgi:hypothetical protein